MMRILPFLFLLPVLVASSSCTRVVSSAIAKDDRPASPQPAIVSPVPAPLTIESLAGTYKGAVDEKELTDQLIRRSVENVRLLITSKGTYEFHSAADGLEFMYRTRHGKVNIDGNKLIFTADLVQPIAGVNGSTQISKCSDCCTFTLHVSADGKTLLVDNPPKSSLLPIHAYVKQ